MEMLNRSLEGIAIAKGNSIHKNLSYMIKRDILEDKLRKGAKLTEQDLCEKYGVSRTPIREAFFQLESEGLIEIIPNRGAFVVGLSSQDKIDIQRLRALYEVQATQWAVERITASQLEKLSETFEFMEFYTMKKDYTKMININSYFHQVIYKASQNKLLEQTLSLFQTYTSDSVNLEKATLFLDEILAEHRVIYEAFLEKNPKKGSDAMAAHLENSILRKKAVNK